MQESFKVENVKCGGCVQAIVDGIGKLEGVAEVQVELDGSVRVDGTALDRSILSTALAQLGYPETAQ